jgi:hypothetical protein
VGWERLPLLPFFLPTKAAEAEIFGEWLDTVVCGAESVFVGFAGGGGFGVGVVLGEVGGVPMFHGDHGVVWSGEGFFGANSGNPIVSGFLVG